jgi:hypothetical protein
VLATALSGQCEPYAPTWSLEAFSLTWRDLICAKIVPLGKGIKSYCPCVTMEMKLGKRRKYLIKLNKVNSNADS